MATNSSHPPQQTNLPNFTFLPQTFNPNPNPYPPFPPQLPNSTSVLPLPPCPPPDLAQTTVTVKTLIDHSERVLEEVLTLLRISETDVSSSNVSCPFDSRHVMPAESLFRHSLVCTSSPGAVDPNDLPRLNYRDSLKSESELCAEEKLVFMPLEESGDLCFSLDDDSGYCSNFFYRDCPGVVVDSADAELKRVFTLPAVLAAECINYGRKQYADEGKFELKVLLPSEFWTLNRELDGSIEIPASCSSEAIRASACLWSMKVDDARRWIIANSPVYGVVIDPAMRDHVLVLLTIGLKAIMREATCLVENHGNNSKFNCPIMFGSLSWLCSLLSILYGQANGKLFAVNMLKNCLLSTAHSSILQSKGISSKADGSGNCASNSHAQGDSEKAKEDGDEILRSSKIYVSQVAAAVAALYERRTLEERIRGLRFSKNIPRFQLLHEYEHASSRADAVRQQRIDFRPLIEHDGLFLNRSRNQDDNKTKTIEELLAEERDYKRRRTSYRGKKIKRKPSQVMHDIIEEHMEEIKQAGGIGCFLGGAFEKESRSPGVSPHDPKASITLELQNPSAGSDNVTQKWEDPRLAENTRVPYGHLRNYTEKVQSNASSSYDLIGNHRQAKNDYKKHRSDMFNSPVGERSSRRHSDSYRYEENHHDDDAYESRKYQRGTSSRSKQHQERSYSSSRSSRASEVSSIPRQESMDRHANRKKRSSYTHYSEQDSFNDRYDPSATYNEDLDIDVHSSKNNFEKSNK